YGQDLVVISVHYPCSDLRVPYQGRVFSISGTSTQYESLSSAISGGLYHPNCKHTSTPFAGDAPATPVTRERNQDMYDAQMRQREIERKIRTYKRRKASAITEAEEKRAQQFISKWQKNQRQHIDSNPFLRRKYDREQI
ncbi:MAG TPA: phage minor capsid protein, partial [Massilibacterium sp.]|nr:phage minor capsid protein [Massilibacterium sp.]